MAYTNLGGLEIEEGLKVNGTVVVSSARALNVTSGTLGGATNNVSVDSNGNFVLNGDATVYEDLRVALANIKAPASDAPNMVLYKGCEIPAYSATATNNLYFSIQIPHNYKLGSDIEFHIHAAYPNTNSGDSYWQFTYAWANINGVFPTQTTKNVTIAAPGVADKHVLHHIETITGTDKTASSVLLCSISRIGGNAADTYGSVIYAISADFHYQIDKLGEYSI